MRTNPHRQHGRSPASKVGEWLSTHITRGIVSIVACVAFWFLIDPGLISLANFIESGAGATQGSFDVDPNVVLGVQGVGCILITFWLMARRHK